MYMLGPRPETSPQIKKVTPPSAKASVHKYRTSPGKAEKRSLVESVTGAMMNPENTPEDTYLRILETAANFAPKNIRVELMRHIRSGKLSSGNKMAFKYRFSHALNQAVISYLTTFISSILHAEIVGNANVAAFFKANNLNFADANGRAFLNSMVEWNLHGFIHRLVSTFSPSGLFQNYITSDSGLLNTLKYESDTKRLLKDIEESKLLGSEMEKEVKRRVGSSANFFNWHGLDETASIKDYLKRILLNLRNQLRAAKEVRVKSVIERMKTRHGMPDSLAFLVGYGYFGINYIKGKFFTLFVRKDTEKAVSKRSAIPAASALGSLLVSFFSLAQNTFNNYHTNSDTCVENIGRTDSLNIKYLFAVMAGNKDGISGFFDKRNLLHIAVVSAGEIIGKNIAQQGLKRFFETDSSGKVVSGFMSIFYNASESNIQALTQVKCLSLVKKLLLKVDAIAQKKRDNIVKSYSYPKSDLTGAQLQEGLEHCCLEIKLMQDGIGEYIEFLGKNPDLFESRNLIKGCILNLYQHRTNLRKINEDINKMMKEVMNCPTSQKNMMKRKLVQAIIMSIVAAEAFHEDYLKIITLVEQEHAKKWRKTLGYPDDADIITVMADPRVPKTVPSRDKTTQGISVKNIERAFGISPDLVRTGVDKFVHLQNENRRAEIFANAADRSTKYAVRSVLNPPLPTRKDLYEGLNLNNPRSGGRKPNPAPLTSRQKLGNWLMGRGDRNKGGPRSFKDISLRDVVQESINKVQPDTSVPAVRKHMPKDEIAPSMLTRVKQ